MCSLAEVNSRSLEIITTATIHPGDDIVKLLSPGCAAFLRVIR